MKEKRKIFIAFIIGFLLSSGIVYAATLYSATEVSYDNSNSGTSKTMFKAQSMNFMKKQN